MTGLTSNETKAQTMVTIKQLFWDTVNKMYRAYDIDLYNDGTGVNDSEYAYKQGLTTDITLVAKPAASDKYVYDIPLGSGVKLVKEGGGDSPPTVQTLKAVELTNEKLDAANALTNFHPNFDGMLFKGLKTAVPSTYLFEGFGSKEELIHDTPSIGFPIDNDAQDLTSLGEIGEQKDWGQMKVDGKLDKWKSDRRFEATCLGRVWSNLPNTFTPDLLKNCGYPQVEGRGCMFKRGWNAPVFRIKVYKNNRDYNDKPRRDRVPREYLLTPGDAKPDHGDELRIYNGVRFLNWTPTEDQSRVKESLSFSVEDMTVISDYELKDGFYPDFVEAEFQPVGYDYTKA